MMDKQIRSKPGVSLQMHNAIWWNQNPMNYDWHGTTRLAEGTQEYFDEIDRRHFASSPSYRGVRTLDRLIPFDQWRGKRVLEIGCGLGSHTQLLAQARSVVTAIDITERAVSDQEETCS